MVLGTASIARLDVSFDAVCGAGEAGPAGAQVEQLGPMNFACRPNCLGTAAMRLGCYLVNALRWYSASSASRGDISSG